ncbi:pyruvate formate-lyase-activating protein [Paenibacillus sp. MSJ-34]|uniref:pyruvate formate-lyase-activating protein n=1 Tax=Paenibacillus sp. MSJ-34 TaxID=2841529 RepID=UPI001C0F78A2|nr:pyruvate formate-lyase-activating protein [Paenibacillus sp. MSJ-34]MBU5443073.1 pyruvate formate lyase-activating protein [Paenibacillus sp. MSJ-34]
MNGRIHSLETFGTVDGPGIRFVLFMQGCALQCQYCHNPDTWDTTKGTSMSVEEVAAEIEPYLSYYNASGGGLTVSGGEPTLQAPFVSELFREVKRRWGMHTTLDTNGFCEAERAEELLDATDLVLLDIKHIDPNKHLALTAQKIDRTLKFARRLSDSGKKMWIRLVYVPGIHNDERDLIAYGELLGTLHGVEKFEILPYHQMGVYKWEQLGKAYPLAGVPSPADEEIARAYRLIEQGRQAAAKTI